MSMQITVRLDEEIVAALDQRIQEGLAAGRAEFLNRAARHELRRLTAERDAEIYAACDGDAYPDLADFNSTALGEGLD